MEKHMFLATVADGQQLLHGAKGRETANTHPESAFGWVLIGWALGRSLSFSNRASPKENSEASEHKRMLCQINRPNLWHRSHQ